MEILGQKMLFCHKLRIDHPLSFFMTGGVMMPWQGWLE
jgi:hypothetical protein